MVARTSPGLLGLSQGRGRVDGLETVAALFGHGLWPWQSQAGRMGLARRGDRWRYAVNVVSVPRQSGKTRFDFLVCVDRCLNQPGAQVWYTAQSRTDAALRFRELVRLLRASPLVEDRHRGEIGSGDFRVRSGIGDEEVAFSNGSQLRIFAPAEDSLHGSVTDLVVVDEARFFDAHRGDGLMAAALPTQATRDGQVWITSTAGDADSGFLLRQLEIARASLTNSGHVGLCEWGIGDDTASGDLLATVWKCHPAAGQPGGPRREALAVAADQMPAAQFAHEYGNLWRTAGDARVLSGDAWAAIQDDRPLPDGRPVFAADVPLDRGESPIVACVDGVVELVDTVPAVAVAGRLLELVDRWDPYAAVVDAAGPAGTVADKLRPVCDRLVVSTTRDLAAACAMFYDAVAARTVRVRPSLVLSQSAADARKRQVGQSWVWSRVDGGSPIVAMSLAFWGWDRARTIAANQQQWVAF
jgi:hypothetical protein